MVSICALLWAALTLLRSRKLVEGEAGGTTRLTYTPASISALQQLIACERSSSVTATTGLGDVPTERPSARSPLYRRSVLSHNLRRNPGSLCRICSASRVAATIIGEDDAV